MTHNYPEKLKAEAYWELLRERFFWPGMYRDTEAYIAQCNKCVRRKSKPHVAPLQPILVSQPLELVHMDFLSLEPSKGNIENVLVITDHFTRYALAFPSKTQSAQATAKILWDNFIVHYGFPSSFISDQGRNFESELIAELCAIAKVDKVHTTPYHPMTNGMCERFNSTLCNMLGTMDTESKQDWKSYLGAMTHAYNCTPHVSTTYSPYYLMFGRHPRLPIDLQLGVSRDNVEVVNSKTKYVQRLRKNLNYAFGRASDCAAEQAKKYKRSYDKKTRGQALQKNDLVLVKVVAWTSRHKIQNKWEEDEYYVVDHPQTDIPVYRVKNIATGKEKVLHRNLLLPLGVQFQPEQDSSSDSESDDEDSQVEIKQHGKPPLLIDDRKLVVDPTPSVHKPSLIEKSGLSESVRYSMDSKIESGTSSKSNDPLDSDITLDSKYLIPVEDETSSLGNTGSTQVDSIEGVGQPSTLSLKDSSDHTLIDTKEFLDFVDSTSIKEEESEIKTEQTPPDPDETESITESQFSSYMSYHEGPDSSWLTNTRSKPEQENVKDEDQGMEDKGSDSAVEKDSISTVNDKETSVCDNDKTAQDIEQQEVQAPRRSSRRNLGAPPIRYGDPRVHSTLIPKSLVKVTQQVSKGFNKLYDFLLD